MSDTYRRMLEREIARWRGAKASFEKKGKHRRVTLQVGDRSRFVIYPDTPGDVRGYRNAVAFVRRELARLGARKH